jgi:hypothetical protein
MIERERERERERVKHKEGKLKGKLNISFFSFQILKYKQRKASRRHTHMSPPTLVTCPSPLIGWDVS